MNINRQFDYQPVERITRPDGVRHYLCAESSKMLPSATTIIGATSDDTGLLEWRKRVGDEKADRERDQATQLGSLMHEHIEMHVMGAPRPKGTNLIRVMAQRMADLIIARGLPNVDQVWGQEVALTYPHMYAGTTDLTGLYRGKQAILDHKSCKKILTKQKVIEKGYFDQVAAYAMAHDYHYGTDIQVGVVFVASRDLDYAEFAIEGAELEHYKMSFLARVERFFGKFGDPVTA